MARPARGGMTCQSRLKTIGIILRRAVEMFPPAFLGAEEQITVPLFHPERQPGIHVHAAAGILHHFLRLLGIGGRWRRLAGPGQNDAEGPEQHPQPPENGKDSQ